jgi:hypothetical protein
VRIRRAFVVVTVAVAVAMLSGCSLASGDTAPGTVDPVSMLAQATSNAKAATAVHLHGTGQCQQGPFMVDMILRKDGSAAGAVTYGKEVVSVVGTPDALYLNATETFWTAQSDAKTATRIGSRWLKISKVTNPCIAALTDMPTVLANYLGYPGTPVLQQGTAFGGHPARQVGVGSEIAFWIKTDGTLLPINVHDSSTNTDIQFDRWSADLQVLVPPGRDVVTPTQVK